jgi:hypothetical protein
MAGLSQAVLSTLKNHRLPELNLGDEFIHPHYAGGSVLNLPDSICRLLGVPGIGAGPLLPEILEPVGTVYGGVLVVVVDALSYQGLARCLG